MCVLWEKVLPRLEHRNEEEVGSSYVWPQPICLEPLDLEANGTIYPYS